MNKVTIILAVIGGARLVFFWLEAALDDYVRARVAPFQRDAFHVTQGLFRVIDIAVTILLSISPATLNAALQTYIIGDRDLKIHIPHKTMQTGNVSGEPLEKNQIRGANE